MQQSISAAEANKITEKNEKPISDLFSAIKSSAERGENRVCFLGVPDQHVLELVRLGYSISKNSDPIGMIYTAITW